MSRLFVSIYGLSDPRTDQIRYIGRSVSPLLRLSLHSGPYASIKLREWTADLGSMDLKPSLVFLEECEVAHSRDREEYYIALYRSLGNELLNTRSNGHGKTHDPLIDKSSTVSIKFSAEQMEFLKEIQAVTGAPLATIVRRLVFNEY